MCTDWGTVGAGRGERFAGESYVKGEAGQMTDYKWQMIDSGRKPPSLHHTTTPILDHSVPGIYHGSSGILMA